METMDRYEAMRANNGEPAFGATLGLLLAAFI